MYKMNESSKGGLPMNKMRINNLKQQECPDLAETYKVWLGFLQNWIEGVFNKGFSA